VSADTQLPTDGGTRPSQPNREYLPPYNA
jgi:hypothetical protein